MEKQNYSLRDIFKFYINVMKEDKKLYIIPVFIVYAITGGLLPIIAIVLPRYIIDSVQTSNYHDIYLYVGIFAALSIMLYIISSKLSGIANGQFMSMRILRSRFYNRKFKDISIAHLEDSEFHKERNAAFAAFSSNFSGFEGTLSSVFDTLPRLVTLIGLVVILGSFNPFIVIVVFLLSILQYIITSKSKKMAVDKHVELSEKRRKADYYFHTGLDFSYGKDIRLNEMVEPLSSKHKEESTVFEKLFNKIRRHELRFLQTDSLFLLITNGLTYYLVVYYYFEGQISLGEVSQYIWSIIAISVALKAIIRELAQLRENNGQIRNYLEFINMDVYFDLSGDKTINQESLEIEFINVSFKYPKTDKYVLKDINLRIKANEKLALVGVNGSGKTTLVKLLCRFYTPTSGKILINGIDIIELDNDSYRKLLAVVFQDVNIYAASVIENITGFDPSEEEKARALNALDKVNLMSKIDSYDQKENKQLLKVIDTNGVNLSGGEAQKLSIARAIYKENTRLIILDEPTASLDAIAEKEIYDNFKNLIANRTAIMISHRLASTRFCDNIAFLEDGVIKEYGPHNTLLEIENGIYKNMFEVQGKYYQEGAKVDE